MAKKDKDLVEKDEELEENAKAGKNGKAAKDAKNAKAENVEKKSPKNDKKADKNKKPNIFVRMGRKLKETFSELKRVTWPSLPKALKATGVVLVIVLIFTVLVTVVNYGFGELLSLLTGLGG